MKDMLDCTEVRPRIDELIHGELSPEAMAGFEHHLERCARCAAALAGAEALQIALLSMPVPEPRPGFAADALARARRRNLAVAGPAPGRSAASVRPPSGRRLRPGTWWGGLAGAMAAGILLSVLWGLRVDDVQQPGPVQAAAEDFRLTLFEPRDITIAIDAEEPMSGARLTVTIDGGISLLGFGDTRELSWETDLERGTNLLALPVLAHSREQGRLTAVVEHEARRQRIELTLQGEGTAAGNASAGEQL